MSNHEHDLEQADTVLGKIERTTKKILGIVETTQGNALAVVLGLLDADTNSIYVTAKEYDRCVGHITDTLNDINLTKKEQLELVAEYLGDLFHETKSEAEEKANSADSALQRAHERSESTW